MKHTTLLVAAFAAASIAGAQASIVTGLSFSGIGSVSGTTSGDSLNFTLTGGDDGSEAFSSTQLLGNVTQTRSFTFLWNYATSDSAANYDPAGYVLNGSKTVLIDSGDANTGSGTVNLSLTAGDTFGWYVDSTDSLYGAGNLTITANNSSVAAVPEPSDFLLGGIPALLGGFALFRRRAARKAAR